ncbi:hypothetical protein [Ralstonia phage RPZH3]|nr:hypothetical protein [Ralstonia phage RPZH3]
MSHIAINNTSIRRDANGRYCLNDLHRAAGGEKRHQPSDFLRTQHTSDLVAELTDPENPGAAPAAPVQTIRGGAEQGTYVAKELVYAYAMWISAAFHLKVIRTFDAVQHQSAPAPTFQVPTTLAGALRLAAEQAEAIERQQQLLEEQRPKVEFVERYVVPCHANWSEYGKGAGIKADDKFTVPGCWRCHAWLDAGSAPRDEKRQAWERAYKRWSAYREQNLRIAA